MACALRDRYQAEMDKLQLQNGLDEVFKVIDLSLIHISQATRLAIGDLSHGTGKTRLL